VFFAVLLIGGSVLLGALTIAEQQKIVTDMGLAAINLIGVMIAIFVGISLVSKEIERRTIYTLLAKPVGRSQFILGKYAGLTLTLAVNLGIMWAVFLLTLWMTHSPIHAGLFQALQLIVVELLLVTAAALLFSTFASSTMSATFTVGLYVIGHLVGDLKGIAEGSPNEALAAIMTGLYYLCPNLEILNVKGQAAAGVSIPLSYQVLATSYGMLYAVMLLTIACAVFQRRDF
jgi:ABC-type transport system involved in multi-copper enzyme maturation permease subunit